MPNVESDPMRVGLILVIFRTPLFSKMAYTTARFGSPAKESTFDPAGNLVFWIPVATADHYTTQECGVSC
jgi:hypothetical protein